MTNNPYQAPSSNVDNTSADSTYDPKILSTKGRIGRLRYLAYSLLSLMTSLPIIAIISLSNLDNPSSLGVMPWVVMGFCYLLMIIWMFVLTKRRLNDLNITGWFSITLFVPVLNVIAPLVFVFVPGTKASNRFGPLPAANSIGVKIAAGTLILLVIGTIVSAAAIPFMAS